MKQVTVLTAAFAAVSLALATPAWSASSVDENLRQESERALVNFMSSDSALTNFFAHSAGYAIFPGVRRTALSLPGGQVPGMLYEQGRPVGEAWLAELNLPQQEPATAFHEVIFFETAEALDIFKQGRFELSTALSPVPAAEGAALSARYRNGVVVFTIPRNGLMETITLGEQKFSFKSPDLGRRPVE